MDQIEINAFTNDALIPGVGRADKIGGQVQFRVFIKFGDQFFFRKLYAIACHTGKTDFQRVTFRAHGFNTGGLTRRLRRGDNRFGGEIKGDAQHVGIFHVEKIFIIEIVGLSAQGAANDLFTQKLGAESADTQHVRDGVGVPSFGEHGHRDDAANGIS